MAQDKVYVLMFSREITSLDSGELKMSKPTPLVFAELVNLHEQASTIIMKFIENLDDQYAYSIRKFWELKEYTKLFHQFEMAKQSNSTPLKFDLYWDEDPQVIL